MKSTWTTITTWATIACALAAVSSCSRQLPPAPPASSTPSIDAPTQSPTPTLPPDVAEAQQAARDVAVRYTVLMDKISIQPEAVTNADLDSLTVDAERTRAAAHRDALLQSGDRWTGPIKPTRFVPQRISLSNNPAVSPAPASFVTVVICWDSSGIDHRDKDGKSLLPSGQATTGTTVVTVTNPAHPDQTRWRVAQRESTTPGATCPEN